MIFGFILIVLYLSSIALTYSLMIHEEVTMENHDVNLGEVIIIGFLSIIPFVNILLSFIVCHKSIDRICSNIKFFDKIIYKRKE